MNKLLSRPRLVFTSEEVLHYLHRVALAHTSYSGVSNIGFHRGGVRVDAIDFGGLCELYWITLEDLTKNPMITSGITLYHLNQDAGELIEFTYYERPGDWVRTSRPAGYEERPTWLMQSYYPTP